MTPDIEALCSAVPLVELLERAPADAVLQWTETDGLKASCSMPIGKYAHEAAAALRDLYAELRGYQDLVIPIDVMNVVKERDALQARVREMEKDVREEMAGQDAVIAEREVLRAECEGLRKDAGRWRWWRMNPGEYDEIYIKSPPETWDVIADVAMAMEWVDAAMAAGEKL